jgi:hypothetical protein
MSKVSWKSVLTAAVAAVSLVAVSVQPAHAAGIACGVSISGKVTPSTACEIGSTNNDKLGSDPAGFQVNLDEILGFSDWLFAGKGFEGETALDTGLTLTGDRISGTWTIDDVWATLGVTHLMFVLKGGNPHSPGQYVAYMIEAGATSGTYASPFAHFSTGRPTDISHISVYYRIGDTTIPEPATLALFGLGLAASARRYYRRQRVA